MTLLIIFPVILQTVINLMMLPIGGQVLTIVDELRLTGSTTIKSYFKNKLCISFLNNEHCFTSTPVAIKKSQIVFMHATESLQRNYFLKIIFITHVKQQAVNQSINQT